MAGRQTAPHQRPSIAASAASLVLLAWCAGAATAAPSVNPQCDSIADPSLEFPVHELSAEIVSHDAEAAAPEQTPAEAPDDALTPARYLLPQAREAAREAFQEVTAPIADVVPPVTKEVATPRQDDADESPAIKSRIPGVSADDLQRYRRQMYRTDI